MKLPEIVSYVRNGWKADIAHATLVRQGSGMWRSIALCVAAAASGSFLGTVVFVLAYGSTRWADPFQMIFGWSLGTMLFTIPGAILLAAFQKVVVIGRVRSSVLATLVFGGLAGATMLFIPIQTPTAAVLGGLYGLTTASAFVTLQRFLASTPKLRA